MTEQQHLKFESEQLTKYNALVDKKNSLKKQILKLGKEIDKIESTMHDIEIENYNSLWETFVDYKLSKKDNSK